MTHSNAKNRLEQSRLQDYEVDTAIDYFRTAPAIDETIPLRDTVDSRHFFFAQGIRDLYIASSLNALDDLPWDKRGDETTAGNHGRTRYTLAQELPDLTLFLQHDYNPEDGIRYSRVSRQSPGLSKELILETGPHHASIAGVADILDDLTKTSIEKQAEIIALLRDASNFVSSVFEAS